MRNHARHAVVFALPLLSACPVEQAAANYFSKWGDSGSSTGAGAMSSSASSSSEPPGTTGALPTTSGDTTAEVTGGASTSGGVSTTEDVGGSSGGSSSTGGDKGVEDQPVDVELHVSPSPVAAVGEVQVSVWTSRPVASIDIFDNDVPLVLGAVPAQPVHAFEVTSDAVPGDGTHTLRAVAHAEDGVSGEDVEELLIDVPKGGTNVWPPYVQKGPITGFTSAALHGNGVALAGFTETNGKYWALATRLDGTTGQPDAEPIMLGQLASFGPGRGPAIAAADDGAVFVVSTEPYAGATTWMAHELRFGEPLGWKQEGDLKTSAHAVAVAGDVVIVAGAYAVKPGTHDLKVWWLSRQTGKIVHDTKFALTYQEDMANDRDEVARAVAFIDGEIVVVGEREIKDEFNEIYRRAVVLRYSVGGDLLGKWTSAGGWLNEDAGMAVAPLRAGGFVVTGWARKLGTSVRQVRTWWFNAAGEPGPVRTETTPTSDASGYALSEDREGKIIVAGTVKHAATDVDAWAFALPGPLGEHVWDVVRDGPGHGPDDAAGLAVDAWGHAYVVGSEFDDLKPQAFALRLYP